MHDPDTKSLASLFVSYLCSFGSFALHNASTLLSCLAAMVAILASFYAYRVNRAKMRHMQARDEVICLHCLENLDLGPPAQCPFPSDQRPPWCHRRDAAVLRADHRKSPLKK